MPVPGELSRFPRWLVAAPRYLRTHGRPKSVAGLAKHTAIVQGDLDRWTLGDESVRVHGPVRSNSPTALLQLAIAGAGIALLPDWLVNRDLDAGRLDRVLPAYESPHVGLWALHRIELRDVPRVRVFLDHIARAFAYHRPRA